MGNTTVSDEAAVGAAKAGNADDLLAQLAGDEIDRMLADADEKADAINAADAATAAGVVAPDVDDGQLVKSAAEEASAEAEAVAPPMEVAAEVSAAILGDVSSSPAAKEADSALAGELDKLFDELNKEPSPDITDAPAALSPPPAAEPVAEAPTEPVADAASVAVDDATTAEERGGLIEDAAEEEAGEEQDILIEEKLPIYLKPLVWINAPFEFVPDGAKDLLGTIGVVTLMNAVALLAYIHFLRKH